LATEAPGLLDRRQLPPPPRDCERAGCAQGTGRSSSKGPRFACPRWRGRGAPRARNV